MGEGLVSIIVPCYNGADFLEASLRSVLWQTYPNWECILVDDGSTDESPRILQSYAQKDPRFRYVRQNNQGLAAARNTGIDHATGDFLQFLDDDDIIPEKRLQLCVEHFRQHTDADVVYTDYVGYVKGQGFMRALPARIPHEDTFRAFLFEQNVTFATVVHCFMFKQNVIVANKFDTSLGSHAEDIECWIRVAAGGARFSYLDEVLAIYRFTEGTLASRESVLLNAKIGVLQRYENHPNCRVHWKEFTDAMNYLKERLAIGFFMEKSFRQGWRTMRVQWGYARWQSKIKMAGWFILMLFFTKDRVAKVRTLIVRHTPLKWGGWVHYRDWSPPASIRAVMES
jgi:glycosyltransferase involved in cell wall biosynthesis